MQYYNPLYTYTEIMIKYIIIFLDNFNCIKNNEY